MANSVFRNLVHKNFSLCCTKQKHLLLLKRSEANTQSSDKAEGKYIGEGHITITYFLYYSV